VNTCVVKNGQTIIVTERGKVIAKLGPANQSVEDRIWAMVDAGLQTGMEEKTLSAKDR
jgi:antitoxin (DNA-binding transcriptional repressor) of toxin-antitoxin stability system